MRRGGVISTPSSHSKLRGRLYDNHESLDDDDDGDASLACSMGVMVMVVMGLIIIERNEGWGSGPTPYYTVWNNPARLVYPVVFFDVGGCTYGIKIANSGRYCCRG